MLDLDESLASIKVTHCLTRFACLYPSPSTVCLQPLHPSVTYYWQQLYITYRLRFTGHFISTTLLNISLGTSSFQGSRQESPDQLCRELILKDRAVAAARVEVGRAQFNGTTRHLSKRSFVAGPEPRGSNA
jgi:hypothetical protein